MTRLAFVALLASGCFGAPPPAPPRAPDPEVRILRASETCLHRAPPTQPPMMPCPTIGPCEWDGINRARMDAFVKALDSWSRAAWVLCRPEPSE